MSFSNNKYCTHIAKLFICFLFYCICGWIYEVIIGFTHGKGFINRGYLFGPWLPVYGIGAFMLLPAGKLRDKGVIAVMAVSTVIAAITELLVSYIMEAVNGTWLWDYRNDMLNFQGRVALIPGLRFGVLALLMIYIVHPFLKKILGKVNENAVCAVAICLGMLFTADCIARLFLGSNLTDPALF